MNPLTHFPRHPSAPDTYYINGAWAPACITAVEKRFTDAELAAEVHRANWTGLWAEKHGGLTDEGRAKIATVERIYMAPHHDDGPA